MEETLISFETAKLAKEKGFDVPIQHTVGNNSRVYNGYEEKLVTSLSSNKVDNWNNYKYDNIYSAPTQSLLQKWLREVHNTAVMVSFNNHVSFEYYYFIHTNVSKPCSNRICSLPFKSNTYEEALEEGLFEALKLI